MWFVTKQTGSKQIKIICNYYRLELKEVIFLMKNIMDMLILPIKYILETSFYLY